MTMPAVVEEIYVGYQLRRLSSMQIYFQQLRKLADCDAKDGAVLGTAFTFKTKKEKKRKKGTSATDFRVNELFKNYCALGGELAREHPSFKD